MPYVSPFMHREDFGTEDDDFILGSVGNDTISGFEGDDVLVGHRGKDVINGGSGDDVVDGGAGDDVMIGGSGDDVLNASQGDDRLNGGSGSDHYLLSGDAGDFVSITDTSGECDTMDFRGATTSAFINMGAGERSYVDGRVIELAGGEEITTPLDLLHVQDLSGSYSDELMTVKGFLDDLTTGVVTIAPDVTFGITSFRDKPISPFGAPDDHEFREDLALTPDISEFESIYATLVAGGGADGADGEEAQLTALQQIGLRAGSIGWRSDALRVAVLFTDAAYHEAGDYTGVPANNGDTVLDGTPEGTDEDYPSVAQAAMALSAEGIDVVFVTTSSVKSDYEELVKMLGFGEVVSLSNDSSDLIEAVTRGVKKLISTEIEKAIGGDLDDTIYGNALDNIIRGRAGDDTIDGDRGNDFIKGGAGDDDLSGGKGNDTLDGGAGDDNLKGGGGKDELLGGTGNDKLRGGSGSDRLNGGEGDDILDGQGKSDTFIFEGIWGDDTIKGFSPSGTGGADDLLMIDGVDDFETFSAFATQMGDDVVFDNGTSSILIRDIELADMSDADFI